MMQGIVTHAPTEIGLDFHCRLRVLLFLIVSTFLIITLSIFSAFFLHRHLCSRRHRCLVSFKPHHLALNVYSRVSQPVGHKDFDVWRPGNVEIEYV